MNKTMPVIFAGHGSPLNAIEDNSFSRTWRALGASLPRPQAILAISAHWYTHGTLLSAAEKPETIYDMAGFPPALYRVRYPAPGAPALAHRAADLLGAAVDPAQGIDHGVWSVLRWMYPDADIPVAEMSIDADAAPAQWLASGRLLRPLRDEGVLIFASGNVVHNLALVDWNTAGGFAWADEFDGWVRARILSGERDAVADWRAAGPCAASAFRTPDHFAPLLCALGAAGGDRAEVFNDARTLGALSMTGYVFRSGTDEETTENEKGEVK